MNRTSRFISRALVALTLAFPLVTPAAVDAGQPLVIVRFNQPRVYFDQQLYSAISKAVAVKPGVMFDVVSYAPTTGDSSNDQKWQAIAGHNTKAVITAMTGMGVPMERINVTGESQAGLKYDETHVFVH